MALRQVIRNTKIDGKVPPELLSAHLGPNSTDLFGFADSQLIRIMVYFVSNDMVESKDRIYALNGFEAHQDHKLLRLLFSSQDTTAESTVANLMRYAFDAGDSRMASTIRSAFRTIKPNLDPQTLIMPACRLQNLELVKIATDFGASIAAVRLYEVLEGIHSHAMSTRRSGQPLGRICLDVGFVKYLMNHGSPICDTDKHLPPGFSSLSTALRLGNLSLVELLLSPDWKASHCSGCFTEAVHYITCTGPDREDAVRLFLAAGISIPLASAIQCHGLHAMRQALLRNPAFDIYDLLRYGNLGDFHFSLGALDLYHGAKTLRSKVSPTPIISICHRTCCVVMLYLLKIETETYILL